jgi:hypothetical protein
MNNNQMTLKEVYTVRKLENGKTRITASDDVIQAMISSQSGVLKMLSTINERLESVNETVEIVGKLEQKIEFLDSTLRKLVDSVTSKEEGIFARESSTHSSHAEISEEEILAETYRNFSLDKLRDHLIREMHKLSIRKGRKKICYQDYKPVYKRFYEITGIHVEKLKKQNLDGFDYYYGECWPNTVFNMGYGAILTAVAETINQKKVIIL